MIFREFLAMNFNYIYSVTTSPLFMLGVWVIATALYYYIERHSVIYAAKEMEGVELILYYVFMFFALMLVSPFLWIKKVYEMRFD